MARQMRSFRGPDGTNWGVEVQVPGASNAMIVFHHPGGKTARHDHVDLHAVARDDCGGENFASFALELCRIARVPGRHVSEHELLHTGLGRYLRRFARGGVAGLERTGGFLVGEGRFVYEDVGAHRCRDRSFRGT